MRTITPLEAVSRTYGILLFGWAVQICLCIDYRLIQTLRACVPHTPYTLVLKFVPSASRVCGAATNAVGGNAGYGLLRLLSILKFVRFAGRVRHAISGDLGSGLLKSTKNHN